MALSWFRDQGNAKPGNPRGARPDERAAGPAAVDRAMAAGGNEPPRRNMGGLFGGGRAPERPKAKATPDLFVNLHGVGTSDQLDVPAAVMIPIVAMMMADSKVAPEEIKQLKTICAWSPIFDGMDEDRVAACAQAAFDLISKDGVAASCQRSRKVLSLALRETAFAFAARVLFADRQVAAAERVLSLDLAKWLEIENDRARMIVEVVSIMHHAREAA